MLLQCWDTILQILFFCQWKLSHADLTRTTRVEMSIFYFRTDFGSSENVYDELTFDIWTAQQTGSFTFTCARQRKTNIDIKRKKKSVECVP